MKVKEQLKVLRSLDSTSLKKRLEELKKELFQLRSSSIRGEKIKPSRFKEIRKEIARIYTILREREEKREVRKE